MADSATSVPNAGHYFNDIDDARLTPAIRDFLDRVITAVETCHNGQHSDAFKLAYSAICHAPNCLQIAKEKELEELRQTLQTEIDRYNKKVSSDYMEDAGAVSMLMNKAHQICVASIALRAVIHGVAKKVVRPYLEEEEASQARLRNASHVSETDNEKAEVQVPDSQRKKPTVIDWGKVEAMDFTKPPVTPVRVKKEPVAVNAPKKRKREPFGELPTTNGNATST